jgi:hypothetical protein
MIDADNAPSEREKWQAEQDSKKEELALRRRELDIRETESKRAVWFNPLVIAVFSAAVAGFGNVIATVYSANQQRAANERKAADTEKLEGEKAEASLILEVEKTGTPDRAADNLKFLVDTKLITNQTRRDDIFSYIKTREAGKGVFIPPAASFAEFPRQSALACDYFGMEPRAVADQFFVGDFTPLRKRIDAEGASCSKMRHARSQLTMLFVFRG